MNYYAWEDVNLTQLSFNVTENSLLIELVNTSNGDAIAELTCTGIIMAICSMATDSVSSLLPMLIGKLEIKKYEGQGAVATLLSLNYGFRFGESQQLLSEKMSHIWLITIEGAEIEAKFCVMNCEINIF